MTARRSEVGHAAGAALVEPRLLGPREVSALLHRRRWLIASIVTTCTIAAIVAAFNRPEIFTARSTLVLERNDTRLFEAVAELQRQEADRSAVETEMDVIRSRLFAGRVVDEFDLVEDPAFNTYLPKPPKSDEGVRPSDGALAERLGRSIGSVLRRAASALSASFEGGWTEPGIDLAHAVPSSLPDESVQRNRAISTLLSRVTLSRSGESLAMSVRVSDEVPARAAALANGVANLYVDWSLELKQDATSGTVAFLRGRVTQLAALIAESERQIADHRRANQLAYDREDDLLRAQMVQLNVQLMDARLESSSAATRLDQIRRLLSEGTEVAGTVVTSELLVSLRGDEARLRQERAELAATFDSLHPKRVNVDAEIASVRDLIADEIQRIVRDLEHEARIAVARVQQFEGELDILDQRLRGRSLAEIRLRELERILLTDQERYEQVVTRLGNLDRQEEMLKPSARVVSTAEVPTEPSSPKRNVIVAGGFVGSAVLSVILVLLLEGLDTRIRGGSHAAQVTGVANLAEVPRMPRQWWRRSVGRYRFILQHPRSAFAEAMRSLFLACRLWDHDRPRVVMLTSSLPGEGKTSIVLGLAAAAARDGVQTIVLDLDLHGCSIAAARGVGHEESALDSYLRGEASLGDLIQSEPELPGLHFLAPSRPPAPLLTSKKLAEMFQELRARYDLVVVDTPPVLLANDAAWLSPFVDAAILVVRSDGISEASLREAVARLHVSHVPLVGTVMNATESQPYGRRKGKSWLGLRSAPRYS